MKPYRSADKQNRFKTDKSFGLNAPENYRSGNDSTKNSLLTAEYKIHDNQEYSIEVSVLCDFEGNVMETTITNADELNLSEGDLVGQNLFDFLDEDLRESALDFFQEVKQNGKASGIDHVKLINGEERSYEYKNVVVYEGDKPVAIRIFAWDITAKIKERQSLVASEARYRGVYENTGLPTIIIEENLLISMVNIQYEELSGYAKNEIEEKISLSHFIDESTKEKILNLFTCNPGSTPQDYECRFTNRKDETFDMLARFNTISNTRLMVASFVDITSRKRIETELQESRNHLRKEISFLKSSLKKRSYFAGIVGKSYGMQNVYSAIVNAADAKANVIIYGESGTGKELVARAIHQISNRKEKKLVTVNCGAIPENVIESEFFGYKKGAFTNAYADKPGYLDYADGGSLFLDEVGELNLNMQVKLLRVIDGGGFIPLGSNKSRKTDLRIISATNRNLRDLIKDKSFREDFFYRIHIITVHLPPLRERKEDIPLLIDHFIKEYCSGPYPRITQKEMDQFIDYDWPGNVRELQNAIQRYLSMKKIDFTGSQKVNSDSEPPKSKLPEIGNIQHMVDSYEKEIIQSALDRFHWHREHTASALGINRKTLFVKMKKYGLNQSIN